MKMLPPRHPWRLAVAGLCAAVLGACSSTLPVTIHSSTPQGVESVLILFGPEEDFAEKSSTAEIASVIQPSKLENYHGYAEFGVATDGDAPSWRERSRNIQALNARYETSQGELRFHVPRRMLDVHPDLAVAVVVRTTDRQYLLKRWRHAALEQAEDDLVVDVSAQEIRGSY